MDDPATTTESTHDLPAELLRDDEIELRLIRFLPIGDLSKRNSASAFLAAAPEYRFAIHRRPDGLRVGRVHVRTTDDPAIAPVMGHMGYAVDEEHRRRGYATRAICLMTALAAHLGQKSLWIIIETDNIASRRAAERAGFELIDEVDTHSSASALGIGPRVCRYAS